MEYPFNYDSPEFRIYIAGYVYTQPDFDILFMRVSGRHTLQEVSDATGVSRERIRQIEHSHLMRAHKMHDEGTLTFPTEV